MLICAVDVGPVWLRLVLITDLYSPVFLEGKMLSRRASPLRIATQIQRWEDHFDSGPVHLVGCRQDRWPSELLNTIKENGWHITWISRAEVTQLKAAWHALRPDVNWARGWMMGAWMTLSATCSPTRECPHAIVECLRALFEDRLLELEAKLNTQGDWTTCAKHVRPLPFYNSSCTDSVSKQDHGGGSACGLSDEVPF